MFDVGWGEMAVIAVIILVVLGPKELPHALKTFSHWMRAARKLGSEFQSGVNEIVREAELEDARKQLQGISKHTIEKKIEQAIDPSGDLKKAINETEAAAKAEPAPVEPAKIETAKIESAEIEAPKAEVAFPPTPVTTPAATVEKLGAQATGSNSIVERT